MQVLNRSTGEPILSQDGISLRELCENACRKQADLSKANLSEADLSKANLSEADLSEANLSEANLSEANLSKANLSWADLSWADLSWADLSEANLSEANLSKANLSWADLSEAEIEPDIKCNGSFLQLFNVAEWGPLLAYITTTNKLRIHIGCRKMSFSELQAHWADRTDRPMSRVALNMVELWFKAKQQQ